MRSTEIPANVKIYTEMPEGWTFLDGTTTAPVGYRWIWNRKSRFGGEYLHGLLKDEDEEDFQRDNPNHYQIGGGQSETLL